MKPPFERTVCACRSCTVHCTQQPGPLIPGDLERIAAHRGETVAQAAVNFWASPGATVMDSQTGRVFQIGTITPRLHEGRCVFLDDRDRCTVHAVAPFGCAYFDAHLTEDESQRRSGWALRLILDTPDYAEQRMALPPALSWNPRTY